MMQAARDAARETAARANGTPPLVIAVTVLTSMNEAMLARTGVGDGPRSGPAARRARAGGRPRRRRRLAAGDAADPETLRPDFAIVTPGIAAEAATAGRDDPERTMSAGGAIAAGAS